MMFATTAIAQQTYNITAVAVDGVYYASDGDWFIRMTTEDGYQYTFDIYAGNIVAGTTYTLNDMGDGSFTGYREGSDYVWNATSATIRFTANLIKVPEEGYIGISCPGDVHASMTSPSGDIYNITYIVAHPQSINTVNNKSINIYPNPVSRIATVNAEGLKEVSIIDANGRVVMHQNNTTIDISNLSNGIYLVRVITNNGTSVQKIVKK